MLDLAVVAAALGAALLLAAGGAGHLRNRPALTAALDAHLLPGPLRAWMAILLGPAEVLVGAATWVTWLAAPVYAAPAVALLGASYCALGLYATVLRIRVPTAPCGCFGTPRPATWLVVGRGWLFAGVAGAAVPVLWTPPDLSFGTRLFLLLPAVLVAVGGLLSTEVFGVTQPI
ncbi:MauE/DoxX family redox-associated membrane protein [Micromonospora haikouensis]|uniref:MauE/DoxX family redox-associated membrane protein n=1 Tax=Micromonospora haikouensis TaxID=686309 RepID=UPI0033F9F054